MLLDNFYLCCFKISFPFAPSSIYMWLYVALLVHFQIICLICACQKQEMIPILAVCFQISLFLLFVGSCNAFLSPAHSQSFCVVCFAVC